MGERRLHLNHLASHLFADGVDVRILPLPPSLPQPALHSPACCLQVMVDHLKVPEVGEGGVFGEGSGHSEHDLLCVDVQSVANVDSHLGGDTADQTVDLALKVHIVVDDVDIWMANPSLRCLCIPM